MKAYKYGIIKFIKPSTFRPVHSFEFVTIRDPKKSTFVNQRARNGFVVLHYLVCFYSIYAILKLINIKNVPRPVLQLLVLSLCPGNYAKSMTCFKAISVGILNLCESVLCLLLHFWRYAKGQTSEYHFAS